jgi:hypothetical protein
MLSAMLIEYNAIAWRLNRSLAQNQDLKLLWYDWIGLQMTSVVETITTNTMKEILVQRQIQKDDKERIPFCWRKNFVEKDQDSSLVVQSRWSDIYISGTSVAFFKLEITP